ILPHARAVETDKPFWKRVIETGNQTESDLDRAITLIEQTGAMQETMNRARAYADIAKAALSVMPGSEIKSALADISDFCVERAYYSQHSNQNHSVMAHWSVGHPVGFAINLKAKCRRHLG